MSRIGKLPINIPAGVTVSLTDQLVSVKGPKGALTLKLHQQIQVKQQDNQLTVEPVGASARELWGTYQRLIKNLVIGVTEGFSQQLEFTGVGWRAAVANNELVLHVGYSVPQVYKIPEGIQITVDKNLVAINGMDKQLVGQVAADIRAIRKPEPYKGKGIKYQKEIIRRKAGKQAKSTT